LVLVRLELGCYLGEQNFLKWGRKVWYLHEIGCERRKRVSLSPQETGTALQNAGRTCSSSALSTAIAVR
jgi:hypothetical protein